MKIKNLILVMALVAILLSSSLFCQEGESIIGLFVGSELGDDVGNNLPQKIEKCINKIIQESANEKGEVNDDAVNNIVDKVVNLFEEIFGTGDFTEGELYKSLPENLRKIYEFSKKFRQKNGDMSEEEIGGFIKLLPMPYVSQSNFFEFFVVVFSIFVAVIFCLMMRKNFQGYDGVQ